MKRGAAITAAFAAGAVAGAALILSLPVRGVLDIPGGPSLRQDVVVGEASVPTLLAWTPGRLPDGYAAAVRRVRSVRAATVVRSGVAWMDRWRDGSSPATRPPPGFRIPVEVASIHPASYGRFVPPAERAAVEGLDGVILGRTFAAHHGLGPGGEVTLGGTSVRVEAVVEDELVGAHEVVVPAERGLRLGIARPRYLLVAPRDGASPEDVERALRRLVPSGVRVRIRAPGETPVFRHGDAVLPQVRVKELFGEFAAAPRSDGTVAVSPAWVRSNIRTAPVPILGPIRCHRLILPLVRAALEELARRGVGHLIDRADYGGCYYPRFIASDPGTGLSHHSWGIALDINVSQGLPGRQPTIDPRVVDAFEAQGFKWGGEFLIPDGTHFEFVRFPSP
ncbi:MAG: M15 family metallopeptidase [Actinomycetota bacterium]